MNTIAYSQCWEDPDTVRNALGITPEDDVLAITSAGCNVLALLLDRPQSITAVDVNPAQNHLLELKRAAIVHLRDGQPQQFLGARPGIDRRAAYQTLSEALSPAARWFWSSHTDQIARGIIHAGRFEQYLQVFRTRVLPLIHHRQQTLELVKPKTLEQQRLFFDRVWNTYRWRAVVRVFFSRWLLSRFGRYRGAFNHARLQDVSGHYLRRARHALRDLPVATNYFLQYMATGEYRTALPPYLQPDNHETVRKHAERLTLVSTELLQFLADAPADRFSKFYFSDVFEWYSEEQYEAALEQIARVARPGAKLCYYNNLVRRVHPTSLDSVIESETGLARDLYSRDRSFIFGSLVVERVKK